MSKKVEFESHLKILSFFLKNPTCLDTPRGVGIWIEEDLNVIKKALKKLSEKGYLIQHRARSTIAYGLTHDRKKLTEIKKILSRS